MSTLDTSLSLFHLNVLRVDSVRIITDDGDDTIYVYSVGAKTITTVYGGQSRTQVAHASVACQVLVYRASCSRELV